MNDTPFILFGLVVGLLVGFPVGAIVGTYSGERTLQKEAIAAGVGSYEFVGTNDLRTTKFIWKSEPK